MRRILFFAAAAATGLLALSAPAMAATPVGVGGEQPPAGVVSAIANANTPGLPNTTTHVEQIRQLVQCDGTMYAVGSFTTIKKGSTTYNRTGLFSFLAAAPFTVSSWAPVVVGPTNITGETGTDAINTIAFANGNCADAYIGGNFTSVNGTAVNDIAEIDTTTGNVVTSFAANANNTVDSIVASGNHLLVGGKFTAINGSTIKRLVSLSPATGLSDGFVNLSVNSGMVYNQQLSHNGTLDLIEGSFTTVGGQSRPQMAMLNVSGTNATVTAWSSPTFAIACTDTWWARAAAWSPDDSTVYVATTGFHEVGVSSHGPQPAGNPCDVAMAFPATQASVSLTWDNQTGCDSLFAIAADTNAVYASGHERYSMNQNACDTLGAGGYNAPGMEGMDPANGNLYVTPTNSAGYYSRSRGIGADDELVTSAGLWIASDNDEGNPTCGGVTGRGGICFLPY